MNNFLIRFEEKHINNSLNLPFVNNQFLDLYLEFLEHKSNTFFSLEKLEVVYNYSDNFYLYQSNPNSLMSFIVIVGNQDMKNQELVDFL